jgi:thiol-disulfide isomerase/thioredoxin
MQKILFFTAVLFLFSCGGKTEAQITKTIQPEATENYVVVYDFHMKHRCKTCIDIEETTKRVLKETFSEAMERKKISFKLVDAEDPKNEALVEEYGAFGTTLALCVVKNGEKEITDITPWAFKRSGSEKFEPELIGKIQEALGKL